jgi:hypothetical protein
VLNLLKSACASRIDSGRGAGEVQPPARIAAASARLRTTEGARSRHCDAVFQGVYRGPLI